MSEHKSETNNTETGNANLLMGGGVAAYGVTLAVTSSFICPACIIVAPALLAMGGVQKLKYLKSKQKAEKE